MNRSFSRPPAPPAAAAGLSSEAYGHHCKPGLVAKLRALQLDVTYERAEGDYLWYRGKDGRPRRVLDLVGGYGANLFGHYHPDLTAVARGHLDAQTPVFAQASCRAGAGRLAEALCEKLGDHVVTFVNSGAEAVEAALKHAYLERPRPLFWAVRGGFHGKTLGAVQMTWSQQGLFPGMGPRVRFLDPDDPADWESAAREAADVSAAVFEPIAGEGGVRPRPPAFLEWLERTCRAAGIPLIADEIQTGMGRTGHFLACEGLGLRPDYVCLGKALGGGLAKIGAMLVRRERYVEEFSLLHSSTFAEDDPACLIGLEALRVLDRDGLPARCLERGDLLRRELETLQARYPDRIAEVRGLGLMVGLELRASPDSPSYLIRAASQNDTLAYFGAAYLLHAEGIRVMPTLSQPLTVRVQPSAYVSADELSRFVRALEGLCRVLRSADGGRLLDFRPRAFVAAHDEPLPAAFRSEEPETPRRVAFLTHLLSEEQLGALDPSLGRLAPGALADFMDRTARVWAPMPLDRIRVRSIDGPSVHLQVVGLGMTARQMIRDFRDRNHAWMVEKMEEAVAAAVALGCRTVGFGGYSSIVASNCKRVKGAGAGLTTGNSLTVGMGIEALLQSARGAGIDLGRATLGVVGAGGNIAATYAEMVAPLVGGVVLVVRDRESPRTAAAAEAVRRAAPGVPCTVADDCSALVGCSLVVAASNSPDPLIRPEHLGSGPVVVCDISIPSDVAPEVYRDRPNAAVIRGGVVRLPLDPDFAVSGIDLPPGHSLACMAETLLMGLEEERGNWSVGAVTPEGVRTAMAAARRHGFAVADAATLSSREVNSFLGELRGRPEAPAPRAATPVAPDRSARRKSATR